MSVSDSKEKMTWRVWLTEKVGFSALVSLVVSTIVSAVIGGVFSGRLETSKEKLAYLMKQKEQFDTAQNEIITELGLYTSRAFESGDVGKKEQLLSAIITAQLQLTRLQGDLKQPDDKTILVEYSSELDKLAKELRSVSAPKDLKPVYVSTQKILGLHDKVSERVRNNVKISIF